mmetsp:Transcript_17342/g.17023  ORF Transcript_17342/g.17023 Transcript_17342/m.17023 type:complete len:203 (-) Transcript_17342:1-609(-)
MLKYNGEDLLNKNQKVRDIEDEGTVRSDSGREESKQGSFEKKVQNESQASSFKSSEFRANSKSKVLKELDCNFSYISINNTQFAGEKFYNAPLCKVNDGYMDVVIQEGSHIGTCKILKLMLNFEKGQFFNNQGDIKQQLSINYKKVKHFTLKPDLDFLPKNEQGEPDYENQTFGWYSIDGEKYPPCEITGVTIKKGLAVTML